MRNENENSDAVSSIISFLLVLGGLIYVVWSGAFVIDRLWDWFVLPLFDVPDLTLLQAAGLALIVGYMTRTNTVGLAKEKTTLTSTIYRIFVTLISPWVTLLIGFVIHSFQ